MNELLELINSVKVASEYNEVELWGDKKSFDELVKIVVNGKLASEIYHNAKKIYPLKRVEIIKSKVIN